jgi:hypothetical protein
MKANDVKQDSTQAPLVVLFGWSGARDKHLKRYAQAYAELGVSTMRGTSKQWYGTLCQVRVHCKTKCISFSPRDFLINPSRMRRFAMEAFEAVEVRYDKLGLSPRLVKALAWHYLTACTEDCAKWSYCGPLLF